MSNRIIVEFSGWVECDSDKVKFVRFITNDVITGAEWLKLSEDDRDDYMLEDCIEAQKTSVDGSYEHLDVIIVDENHNEVTSIRTHS